MSKQILATELAEITVGLILKPEILGELEERAKHLQFLEDIANVIATHCGGTINGISDALDDEPDSDSSQPMVSVSPCGALPSLNNNVWSAYDPEGWEDEVAEFYDIDVGETADKDTIRTQLRSCFNPSESKPLQFHHQMIDWQVAEKAPLQHASDAFPWVVNSHIGNQINIDFLDSDYEQFYGVLCGIHLGVPALRLMQYGKCLLHIQMTNDGVVLVPERNDSKFQAAPLNRHSFEQGHAYVLTNN